MRIRYRLRLLLVEAVGAVGCGLVVAAVTALLPKEEP